MRAYIAPKESIILNVLSATVDFPTCESIRMSQQVDRTGERTLAVVTKADRAPEGLLEKVTVDDVRIGLGYVCVRNRIGGDDETYDEARAAERRLFEEHPLLRQIDKSMVGIPTLARRLTQIQAAIIGRCLPDIVRQINDKLSRSSDELGQMPPDLGTVADAVREFYHIVKQTRASLEKLLVRGEFDEYPDDHGRHGTARIAEMLDSYASKLQAQAQAQAQDADSSSFLVEEMRVLEETKGINLPNFLPRPAFQVLLRKKLESIEHVPHRLVTQVWDYVGDLVMGILHHHSRSYPQVQPSCRRAVQSLMDNARERSARHVKELIHMELVADYTANPDYTAKWNDMMTEGHARFLDAVEGDDVPALVTLPGFGDTDVSHLRLQRKLAGQAFDLKARLAAYWTCVVLRLVDGLALHVLYSVKRLVEKDLEDVLAAQVVGTNLDGVERMLVPSPATALKRDRLRKSIALLRECREVVANTMDKISVV
ncbi:hypothetical protein PR202_ga30284 [Eleusine coracana subsp. coracana]|uniref:Uncharacterized protein n=1 Tax=Eleusine coracana subsp. coracana TaxID=191504 RepID=A0AAV5DPA0_ELECO|nr:hypothetical protein PR202_ga30284 [Eleusine coracana subsp. coracana]